MLSVAEIQIPILLKYRHDEPLRLKGFSSLLIWQKAKVIAFCRFIVPEMPCSDIQKLDLRLQKSYNGSRRPKLRIMLNLVTGNLVIGNWKL